jgi:thymidylate synthase
MNIHIPQRKQIPMYLPFDDRSVDTQYHDLLKKVLNDGVRGPTRQGVDVITSLNHTMKFPLSNGFPLITDRSMKSFWRKPIAELLVFMNGGRNITELRAAGCDWWDAWTTDKKTQKYGLAPGDIGPGSYGAAFHDFPMPDGGTFDQIDNLVRTLREHPDDRRGWVTNWIPYLVAKTSTVKPKVTIAPCHGTMYARVLEGKLTLTMIQRSGDVPIGVPANMVQYAAFTLMLAQLTGLEADAYHHHIVDAHIYVDQLESVHTLLGREPRRLPAVSLSPEGLAVTELRDFRPSHFMLSDYFPHPSIPGIPVAI